MLVQDRKVGEVLDIYDAAGNLIVSVHVCRIGDKRVKVGVEADRQKFKVVRRELPVKKKPALADIVRGRKEADESAAT